MNIKIQNEFATREHNAVETYVDRVSNLKREWFEVSPDEKANQTEYKKLKQALSVLLGDYHRRGLNPSCKTMQLVRRMSESLNLFEKGDIYRMSD